MCEEKKQCCQFLEYILRLICFVNYFLDVFNHILVYLFCDGKLFQQLEKQHLYVILLIHFVLIFKRYFVKIATFA